MSVFGRMTAAERDELAAKYAAEAQKCEDKKVITAMMAIIDSNAPVRGGTPSAPVDCLARGYLHVRWTEQDNGRV